MIKSGLSKSEPAGETSQVAQDKWLFGLPALNFKKKGQLLPLMAADSLIAGRYEILSSIARGGMGVVYKARQVALHRLVAVKVLPAPGEDTAVYQRFELEARSLATLSHPNIVSVFDYGQMEDGRPFLVMEFIEGLSLAHILRQQGLFDQQRAVAVISQVCDGLHCAHTQQLIHRDLKPGNILVVQTAAGETAKLIDFGLAKRFMENQQLTQSGVLIGTPLYMSPEQCRGEQTDARSDIYSLGCVLYEMLAGVPPLQGDSHISTVFKHLHELPDYDRPTMRNVNEAMKDVLRNCLQKEQQNRFASVLDLKTALLSSCDRRAPLSSPGTADSLQPTAATVEGRVSTEFDSIDSAPPIQGTSNAPPPGLTRHMVAVICIWLTALTLFSCLGIYSTFHGAKEFRLSCLPLVESVDRQKAFHLALELADTYLSEGRADYALAMYEKARNLSDFRVDFAPAKVAHVHSALGKLYQGDLHKLPRSLHNSKAAKIIMEEFEQTASPEYARTIADIAAVQAQQGKLPAAIESCNQAIEAFRKQSGSQIDAPGLLQCSELRNRLLAKLDEERRDQERLSTTARQQTKTHRRTGIQSRAIQVPGLAPPRFSSAAEFPLPTSPAALPPMAPPLTPAPFTAPPGLRRAPEIRHGRTARPLYRKRKRENKFLRGIRKVWDYARSSI